MVSINEKFCEFLNIFYLLGCFDRVFCCFIFYIWFGFYSLFRFYRMLVGIILTFLLDLVFKCSCKICFSLRIFLKFWKYQKIKWVWFLGRSNRWFISEPVHTIFSKLRVLKIRKWFFFKFLWNLPDKFLLMS